MQHDWNLPRRRLHQPLPEASHGSVADSVVGNSQLTTSASVVDFSEEGKKQQRFTGAFFLSSTQSFAGLSQLVAAPASQIWNTAQSLADQFQQSTSTESLPPPNPQLCSANLFDDTNFDPFQSIDMPSRDRTAEFRTVCKSYEMKIMSNGKHANREERSKLVQESLEFNQRAKRIGRFLSVTCAKMEKLTELAKEKSLFNDSSVEVERLSKDVQEDITGLNNQIAELSQLLAQRKANSNSNVHSKLVVVGLQSKLASVGQNFKKVLDLRTQTIKAKKNNREKFCQAEPVPSSMPKSRSHVLFDDDASASGGGGNQNQNFVLQMDQMTEQAPLLDYTDSYYRDRQGAMENIESSISQLGQIFSQLAHLVQEQGEMITRIDSNVEHTSINVEAAHHELLKYFSNISRNRWLMIKVFGVLMAFIVFFIVFMA